MSGGRAPRAARASAPGRARACAHTRVRARPAPQSTNARTPTPARQATRLRLHSEQRGDGCARPAKPLLAIVYLGIDDGERDRIRGGELARDALAVRERLRTVVSMSWRAKASRREECSSCSSSSPPRAPASIQQAIVTPSSARRRVARRLGSPTKHSARVSSIAARLSDERVVMRTACPEALSSRASARARHPPPTIRILATAG